MRLYLVTIDNLEYRIYGYSFDNIIGHIFDFASTFNILTHNGKVINKPHIKVI